jgi:hypothetical protein
MLFFNLTKVPKKPLSPVLNFTGIYISTHAKSLQNPDTIWRNLLSSFQPLTSFHPQCNELNKTLSISQQFQSQNCNIKTEPFFFPETLLFSVSEALLTVCIHLALQNENVIADRYAKLGKIYTKKALTHPEFALPRWHHPLHSFSLTSPSDAILQVSVHLPHRLLPLPSKIHKTSTLTPCNNH